MMTKPASVDHEAAADVLEDIEANPNVDVKSVDTDVAMGRYTEMVVRVRVRPDDDQGAEE